MVESFNIICTIDYDNLIIVVLIIFHYLIIYIMKNWILYYIISYFHSKEFKVITKH